jgi:hypothetical protein
MASIISSIAVTISNFRDYIIKLYILTLDLITIYFALDLVKI